MALHWPAWFRSRWMLCAALLLVIAAAAIPTGVFIQQRLAARPPQVLGADTPPPDRLLLSQYSLFVHALAFSPDGTMLATAGEDRDHVSEIRLWDCSTGEEKRLSRDIRGSIGSLAFSPDGTALACGSGALPSDPKGGLKESGAVWLWDLATDKPILWQKTDQPITSVVFSPKGDPLAAGCAGLPGIPSVVPGITIYNRATGRAELSLRPGPALQLPSNLIFSDDGKRIACGYVEWTRGPKASPRGVVQVWDAGNGNALTQLHLPKTRGLPNIPSVAFLPEDRLVGSSGSALYVWNLGTGMLEATLTGHPNQITCFALSHDGRLLASGDVFGSIKLWQTSRPQELATLQNLWPNRNGPIQGMTAALAFAPDGRRLASSTLPREGSKEQRGQVKLWDASTTKAIALPR